MATFWAPHPHRYSASPLEALTLHDPPTDVSTVADSPSTPAPQTTLRHSTIPEAPDEPPPPNFYADSITANANHFFASGTLSLLIFVA